MTFRNKKKLFSYEYYFFTIFWTDSTFRSDIHWSTVNHNIEVYVKFIISKFLTQQHRTLSWMLTYYFGSLLLISLNYQFTFTHSNTQTNIWTCSSETQNHGTENVSNSAVNGLNENIHNHTIASDTSLTKIHVISVQATFIKYKP